MKRFIWLFALLPFSVYGQQQAVPKALAKGSFFVDGSGQFRFSVTEEDYTYRIYQEKNRHTEYFFQAGAGYLLEKNFAVGVNFHMNNMQRWDGGWTLLGGPFMRLYFPSKSVYYFFQTGFYLGTIKQVYYMDGELQRITYPWLYDFEMAFGLSIPVDDHIHFELSAGYAAFTESLHFKEYSYEHHLGIWGLKFGMTFLFPEKE